MVGEDIGGFLPDLPLSEESSPSFCGADTILTAGSSIFVATVPDSIFSCNGNILWWPVAQELYHQTTK